jgi:hypothetical protein
MIVKMNEFDMMSLDETDMGDAQMTALCHARLYTEAKGFSDDKIL